MRRRRRRRGIGRQRFRRDMLEHVVDSRVRADGAVVQAILGNAPTPGVLHFKPEPLAFRDVLLPAELCDVLCAQAG